MSELAQAALISGSIFLVVMLTQFGRRAYTKAALLRPLIMVGAFGVIYLKDAPLANAAEIWVYAAGLALGLVFGLSAAAVTALDRDPGTGKTYTTSRWGFLTIWGLAVLIRLAFVWAVTDVPWVGHQFGEFMISNQISAEAVAPFFVLWALTMVIARVIALQIRTRCLPSGARTDLVAV
jgi:membrane protein CcdC involved in cytochrome C biogenesis